MHILQQIVSVSILASAMVFAAGLRIARLRELGQWMSGDEGGHENDSQYR